MLMDIHPVRTEDDYARALKEIEPYFENEPKLGTAESERFEVLATLIEAYEAKAYPMPNADPVDVLHFAIENMGRSKSDLMRILGSHASEILHRRRKLNLNMIRAISSEWHIPVEALVEDYEIPRKRA